MSATASYCHTCGAPQPRATPEYTHLLEGLSDRSACILCYIPVFGVIPAIIFLAAHRYRRNHRVRFNAFQSLYLFVTWLIVSSFPISGAEHVVVELLKVGLFICWIYLLVKAVAEQEVRLPVLGDLAARSATEQL